MQKLQRAERALLWCGAVAVLAILLFPPIIWRDDYDNVVARCYFLLFVPKLSIGVFLWPVTAFLMAGECLAVLLLTFAAAWVVRRLRAKQSIGQAHINE